MAYTPSPATSATASGGSRLTNTPNSSQPLLATDSRATLAAVFACSADSPRTTTSTGQPSSFASSVSRSKSSPLQTTTSLSAPTSR